jgi:hypothetical protein
VTRVRLAHARAHQVAVGEPAQHARDRGGRARAAACDQGGHEALGGDLVEQAPFGLGEADLAGELAPPLEEELGEPLERADGGVDLLSGGGLRH